MKIKRLISLILVMIIMATSLTTNVFALEGCDGVLDTGEIELESYIEWNTFKSKIDGLDSEILDEIRSAESRGVLPEVFPVGDHKFMLKTDLGFYAFVINEDGSYTSNGRAIHFGHFGGGKNERNVFIGSGTPSAGEITGYYDYEYWNYCCAISSIIDYGYYNGDFYVIASGSTDFDNKCNTSSSYQSCGCDSIYNIYYSTMIFKLDDSGTTGTQQVFHSYSTDTYCSHGRVAMYRGDDSLYFYVQGYDVFRIQEYNFKTGASLYTPTSSLIYTPTTDSNGNVTGASLGGVLRTLGSKTLNPGKDTQYPYASVIASYYQNNNYTTSYPTLRYDKTDSGERTYKIVNGFQNNSAATNGNQGSTSGPIGSSIISREQSATLTDMLKLECNKNGFPLYGVTAFNSSLALYTSRMTRQSGGTTYTDGQFRLQRKIKPKIGSDGKYILGQDTAYVISGGMSKNATRLTFSNLSLGSDATIEIYGCPIGTSPDSNYTNLVLLETITNSKNASGTYKTPIYPYGELKIRFLGGESTSGRGEGFKVTDIEYGKYGDSSLDYTLESIDKVHCPHINYSGMIRATIPTNGKTSSATKININDTTVPSTYTYTKVASSVPIQNNVRVYINNTYSSSSSYDAYYTGLKIQLKNTSTGTTYTYTASSSYRTSILPACPTGNYDVYAYRQYTGQYYCYRMTIGSDQYTTVNSTSTGSAEFDVIDIDSITSGFTKANYTFTSSNLTKAPTGTSDTTLGEFATTITLNKGDTYRIRVTSDYSGTAQNCTLRFAVNASDTKTLPSTNNVVLASTNLGNTSGEYIQDTVYLYGGETQTYKIYLYDGYYSNATYKFGSGDKIELTIYRAKSLYNQTYSGTSLESLSNNQTRYLLSNNSTTSTFATTNGANSKYLLYELTIVPGSYTYSNHYVYLNNSQYYLRNPYNKITYMDSYGNEPYYYGYQTYNQYLTGTSFTLKAYDNAFRHICNNIYTSKWNLALNKTIQPATKSGYTPTISTLTINLPKTGNYVYYQILIDDVVVIDNIYANSGYSNTQTVNVPLASGKTSYNLKVNTRLYNTSYPYQYGYQDIDITYSSLNYYADNAGTKTNKYTVNGTKTWEHTITTATGDFSKLKITGVNIPKDITVTVNGTPITSTVDLGWKNTNTYSVVITAQGDGVHGIYMYESLSDLITYELQTKSISDKNKMSVSNTSANLGHVTTTTKSTQVYDRYTGQYSYQYSPDVVANSATISNVSNAYVKIVSSLCAQGGVTLYSTPYPGVTVAITGLQGVTGRSSLLYPGNSSASSIGTIGWVPTNASTITMTPTVTAVTSGSTSYGASGYCVTQYYVIKHTDIPDTKIKTYTQGDITMLMAESDKVMYGDLASIGSDKLLLLSHNGGAYITNGYNTNNAYCVTARASYPTFVNSAGTKTNITATSVAVPSGTQYIEFKPTFTYGKGTNGDYGNYQSSNTTVTYGNTSGGSFTLQSNYNQFAFQPYLVVSGIKTYNKASDLSAVASNADYQQMIEPLNEYLKDKEFMHLTDLSGNTQFDDGRFGVPRITIEYSDGSTTGNKLQRVDVYRKGTDGSLNNLAMIPVNGTLTWFREFDWDSNRVDDSPCVIYHIGNDLMYVGATDVNANTNGTNGRSLAWLRTGHWHLKGKPDEIEGITQGGINNPVKTMETDDADTEIVVNELDMNAKSWQMGHNIKDGKVTDQKLSDDVKKELREINLGTVTFIKGDGEQYRYVPVGTYGVDASTLDGVRLKYGTRYVDLYEADDNQIEVEAVVAMAGNKNIGGSTAGSLSLGENVFTGNVTVDGVSVPVVLQVNVIERPTTSGKTTITLTD